MTSLWAALACGRCLRFPGGPMVFEMAKGENLARHHRNINETTAEDNAPLGWWFSGGNRYAVDNATLITPNMASRWMGYLNETEHWSYEELRSRWCDLAKRLKGKITFIVQLSAFPKIDRLELGMDRDANLSSLEFDRCLVTYPKPISRALDAGDHLATDHAEGRLDCDVTPLTRLRNDSWLELMKPHWTALVPDLAALRPAGSCAPSPYDFALGDYHTVYILVQAPLTGEILSAPKLTLRFIGGKRERAATFVMVAPPRPVKKVHPQKRTGSAAG